MLRRWSIVLLLLLLVNVVFGQNPRNKVNPNGYNVFYYPNGVKASEGYMRNGKPTGFWKNYYPNGQLKSEGNRKGFLLDSIWIFFAPNGDTTEKINYYLGKKNGWYYTYYTRLDSGAIGNIVKSKILYVDGQKQGKGYFYYPDGKLWKIVPYNNNYIDGNVFVYSHDGRLVEIINYRYGNPIYTQYVNQYDKKGRKTGKWIKYYPNGQIAQEVNYSHGKINGYVKKYNKFGTLVQVEYYKMGKLVSNATNPQVIRKLEESNLHLVEKKYPNGQIKFQGAYRDSIPVGLHKFYSPDGKLLKAVWYNNMGIKLGEGKVDKHGKKQGLWTLFYSNGNILGKGQFKNDKKSGQWVYFYPNGKLLQKGQYNNGLPTGKWITFYPNGKMLRVEYYINGLHDGKYFELSPNGDTVLSTAYIDGQLQGRWFLHVGDFMQIGQYKDGKRNGKWITYYMPGKKIMCIDYYDYGYHEGLHKCYYPNGILRELGHYLSNKKNGKWYYYTKNGMLDYTIKYVLGEPVKINGKSIISGKHE